MSEAKITTYSIVMLSSAAVLFVILVVLMFVDIKAFLTMLLLVAVLGFILFYFGFIQVQKLDKELDVTYTTNPVPEAHAQDTTIKMMSIPDELGLPEVFHVSDNIFTYDEAPAVCKAYGAELATYSQVEQAYNAGAEWCGYGWTEGGIALFPTQHATWERLQKEQDINKRTQCGRPGINGGYFESNMKFGVNCYGPKPTKPEGQDRIVKDSTMDRLIGQIKDNIDKLVVSPFNQMKWSSQQYFNTKTRPLVTDSTTNTDTQQLVDGVAEKHETSFSLTKFINDLIQ